MHQAWHPTLRWLPRVEFFKVPIFASAAKRTRHGAKTAGTNRRFRLCAQVEASGAVANPICGGESDIYWRVMPVIPNESKRRHHSVPVAVVEPDDPADLEEPVDIEEVQKHVLDRVQPIDVGDIDAPTPLVEESRERAVVGLFNEFVEVQSPARSSATSPADCQSVDWNGSIETSRPDLFSERAVATASAVAP